MKGLEAYSVMPYSTQILCLEWFQVKYEMSIPICVVDDTSCGNNQICDLTGGRFLIPKLDQIRDLTSGRFLLLYQRSRIMCCRIIASSYGGEICLIMDTQRGESPLESLQMLQTLCACRELPMVLRRAQLDLLCSQQKPSCGGCLVMSLGNYIMHDDDSMTAQQAEQIRSEFADDITSNLQRMSQKHPLSLRWISQRKSTQNA
jgi:hypothetical protein